MMWAGTGLWSCTETPPVDTEENNTSPKTHVWILWTLEHLQTLPTTVSLQRCCLLLGDQTCTKLFHSRDKMKLNGSLNWVSLFTLCSDCDKWLISRDPTHLKSIYASNQTSTVHFSRNSRWAIIKLCGGPALAHGPHFGQHLVCL